MTRLVVTEAVAHHRATWRYRGTERPPFAEPTGPGQRSVWDFPRPPRIVPITSELRVEYAGDVIAQTTRGVEVLETAGAPTYYFPPDDVVAARIILTTRSFHCEWKGISNAVDVAVNGQHMGDAGWQLTAAYPEFADLLGWTAFYPQRVACFRDGERATAQPGGYYGGWVTSDLTGPIKGGPDSGGW